MNVPITEQETIVNIYRDKRECYIWTSDTTMINKLDKMCDRSPDNYKLENTGYVDGVITDKDYRIADKSLISFRACKRNVSLTDEQKKEVADRLQLGRKTE